MRLIDYSLSTYVGLTDLNKVKVKYIFELKYLVLNIKFMISS